MIKAVTIYKKIGRLRDTIRSEGTPAVQKAWDDLEPYVSVFMNGGVLDGTSGKNAENKAGSGDMDKP
jgi:hypothetical protein